MPCMTASPPNGFQAARKPKKQPALLEAILPINIVPLAEQPQHIDTLAHALHAEWHDIAALPQYEYWLGDVFVLPEARGCSVGRYLMEHALIEAHRLGLPELYLLHARRAGGVRQIRLARN